MNKNFTKDDLKVGYVVKTRKGELYMVMPNSDGKLVMVKDNKDWMRLYGYNDDLTDSPRTSSWLGCVYTDKKYDIMEVYGYSSISAHAGTIETDNRPLLWKREESKEMTLEEVEKALGYPVKIVNK